MSRIYLVRHGRSAAQDDETVYLREGDINVPLSDLGHNQARASSMFLKDCFNTHAVGQSSDLWIRLSPYKRAMQTMSYIFQNSVVSENIRHTIDQDRHLCEQSWGALSALEMLPEILPNYDEKELSHFREGLFDLSSYIHQKNPYIATPFFGESPMTQNGRTSRFVDSMKKAIKNGHEDCLVVSHGATMKNIFIEWFNLMPQSWHELHTPNNADVYVISGENDTWQLKKIYDGELMQPCSVDPLENVTAFSTQMLEIEEPIVF